MADPYSFPGTEGRAIQVKTNLYPYKFKNKFIGISTVRATRTTNKGTRSDIPPQNLWRDFKKKFIVDGYKFIPGDVNGDVLTVYSIPAFQGGRMFSNAYPEEIFRNHPNTTVWDVEEYDRKQKPVSTIRFIVKFNSYVNPQYSHEGVEPDSFLKKVVYNAISDMMQKDFYSMKNRFFFSRIESMFPIQDIDFLRTAKIGFNVRFHTDTPKPLFSVNTTASIITRTDIPILQYFAVTVLKIPLSERNFNPKILAGRMMSDQNARALEELVEGLEVYIKGEKTRGESKNYYLVQRITAESARNIQIKDSRRGQQVSINDYYSRITKQKIILPDQRAVILTNLKKEKEKAVPMEFVIISDRPNRVKGNMENFSKQNIIELSSIAPKKRMNKIQSFVEKLEEGLRSAPTDSPLNMIGMNIQQDSVVVDGRVLEKPEMTDSDVLFAPYHDKLVDYVLLDFHEPKDCETEFPNLTSDALEYLVNNEFKKLGITFNNFIFKRKKSPTVITDVKAEFEDFMGKIEKKEKYKKENKLFFFVILNQNSENRLYGQLKQEFHSRGLLSQVIQIQVLLHATKKLAKYNRIYSEFKELEESSEAVYFNIASKVNAKLGGFRVAVGENNVYWKNCMNPDAPTMLIGIDTRLSSMKDKLGRVGVVTSTDLTGTKYLAAVKFTSDNYRYSTNLEDILKEALQNFDPNGRRPAHVLIYRAGMSEYDIRSSKGEAVLEFKQIKQILEKEFKEELPTVTYIGYHRTHNIRFMAPDPDDIEIEERNIPDEDKLKYNVPVGTIIDSEVVNKDCFFLVTHMAVAGTTKPAKYTIVADEWNLTANDMLGFTYTLCSMSPRCTKSVRRPLPINLAALLLEKMAEIYPEEDERDLSIHMDLKQEQFYV